VYTHCSACCLDGSWSRMHVHAGCSKDLHSADCIMKVLWHQRTGLHSAAEGQWREVWSVLGVLHGKTACKLCASCVVHAVLPRGSGAILLEGSM
jgi:hypothetical protein